MIHSSHIPGNQQPFLHRLNSDDLSIYTPVRWLQNLHLFFLFEYQIPGGGIQINCIEEDDLYKVDMMIIH